MRKELWSLVVAVAFAGPAAGTSARIWVTDSASDFSSGVAHGVSGIPSGGLELSRRADRISGLSEATIFCAAEDRAGVLYAGTGDEGKLFRQEPGQPAKLLARLPEKEVTSLLVGTDGTIYAATSPRGKVYRLVGEKSSVYFDPGAQYIWALAADAHGVLYVGTGSPGKIYRVSGAGQGKELYDSQDEHVRCLALDGRGRLWAGTAGKGLVLRVGADGSAETVYDSQKAEISALAFGPGGVLWAAAGSARTAPSPAEPPRTPLPGPSKEKKPEAAPGGAEPGGTVTVTVSTSLSPVPPPQGPRGSESAELVEISEDDSAEVVWSSSDEMLYSLLFEPKRDELLLATGPKGRVYLYRGREAALAQTFDEKSVVALLPDAAVCDSPAAGYRLEPSARGDFVSAVKDTGRISRFGAFRFAGSGSSRGEIRFSFRSGNSSVPDPTWSPWSPPAEGGKISDVAAPPARYLQWKAVLEAESRAASPRLLRVECAYQNRNSSPEVESITAVPTNPPEMSPGAPPSAPESAEPESIFTGLEEKAGPASAARARKRGYLTVAWKAADPEGDEMVYDVDFRPEGSGAWVSLRRDWKVPSLTFDSRLLPDGHYRFRVTASDRPSNPDDPKASSKVSDEVLIDNTPPAIEVVSASREKGVPVVRLRVRDASSPLAGVEWSVNALRWTRAAAEDGMTDSPEESYRISLRPEDRGAYLLIRATDAAGNAASKSLTVP